MTRRPDVEELLRRNDEILKRSRLTNEFATASSAMARAVLHYCRVAIGEPLPSNGDGNAPADGRHAATAPDPVESDAV